MNARRLLAAFYNTAAIIELLLNTGDYSNINKQNYKGYTSLIYAVIKDNIKIVKLLLNVGADINKQNNDGYTA